MNTTWATSTIIKGTTWASTCSTDSGGLQIFQKSYSSRSENSCAFKICYNRV